MINKKNLVILGNGPSLKEFDFSLLSNIDSIGMNAAYRYWERINIFPTHYICLDDQLIETHAKEIHDLIITKKVKTAFLIAKFLDYYPDMIKQDNVYFLESFHGERQKKIANKGKGVPYIKSIPFQESDSSKVTTGSYAIRYAAHLGYNNITILGVDLRYVEIIPEAKKVEGIKLIMESTPKSNPNYFFDDYQRAGDKYNIPNPDVHSGNLHVSAFEVLANDIVQYGWDAKVYNSNKKSILNDKGIFPFIPVKRFAQKKGLSAIVVPTTPRELPQVLINFKAWDQPRLIPYVGKIPDEMPEIIFAFSCQESLQIREEVLESYNKTKYVNNFFSKCQVMFVGLDDQVDYYERDYTKPITGKGYKSGPNEQFFETINLLNGIDDFIFYMETDCVPIRQGWLNHIMDLAQGDSESWVIGSLYRGVDRISDNFFMHINGNALYRVGSQEFVDFVNEYWRVSLYDVIENKDKRIAYDCLLRYLFTGAKPSESNPSWIKYQETAHRFRKSSFVQNISGNTDKSNDPLKTIQKLTVDHSDTFLVHGSSFVQLLGDKLNRQIKQNPLGYNFSWGMFFDGFLQEEDKIFDKQELTKKNHPRLLMIDSTPVGHGSATGQVKKVFLSDWDADCFLQIWVNSDRLALHSLSEDINFKKTYNMSDIFKRVIAFSPDVIYVRPVDSSLVLNCAIDVIKRLKKPVVVHMMDDWPLRNKYKSIPKHVLYDEKLKIILKYSRKRLSISDAMSIEYKQRYSGDWHQLANAIDIKDFSVVNSFQKNNFTRENPFTIRYLGGMAKDMNFQSIIDFSKAVSELSKTIPIQFEIYTMAWYIEDARQVLKKFSNVNVMPLVDENLYHRCLMTANILLITYNFDEVSYKYIGLSLANKLPECMASAVPIIGFGPSNVATIEYMKKINTMFLLTSNKQVDIRSSIKTMYDNYDKYIRQGKRSKEYASTYMSKTIVKEKFLKFINEASNVKEITFTSANKDFSEGRYEDALYKYLELYKSASDPIKGLYAFNVSLSAKKLKYENTDIKFFL